MLILDKQRAIERIMALSERGGQVGDIAGPPKGARPRVAAYAPRPITRAERLSVPELRRRAKRHTDTGAAFPV